METTRIYMQSPKYKQLFRCLYVTLGLWAISTKMALNLSSLDELALLRDDDSCVKWLQTMRLIPENPKCEVCDLKMKTIVRGPNSIIFECRYRGANPHRVRKNALTVRECSTEDSTVSTRTVCDWLSYCREICFLWVETKFNQEEKLGGPGIVVEIDECKMGKRKFNKGRLVEGTWVLGLIEINTEGPSRGGRYRLEICPDNKRDAATLIPLILKHVLPGTTICTDLWKAYFGLTDLGYVHFTVNHSQNFISPTTGANTRTVESSWRALKRSLRSGIPSQTLADHLCEYLYRREVKMLGEDPVLHFFNAVASTYPGTK